jgi:hypothetical protein
VQGTINGIGERCGNADLISIIANLALKKGYEVLRPGSLRKLTEVSRYVYETANMNYRNNQPFVGISAFAHKGGMHVHAVVRNTVTYEHIDPSLVGNERRILISELSGRSNIATKTSRLGLHLDETCCAVCLSAFVSWRTRATNSKRPKLRSTCWCASWPGCTSRGLSGSITMSPWKPTVPVGWSAKRLSSYGFGAKCNMSSRGRWPGQRTGRGIA